MLSLRKEMTDMLLILICAVLLGLNVLLGKASFEAANRYANGLLG